MNVSEYLLTRLYELGLTDMFGVVGDYSMAFLENLCKFQKIRYVGACNELNAAYAADGYARIKGFGAITTTYAVGELSALNGIAGSYSERVPVVMIVGYPLTSEIDQPRLFHHSLGGYEKPRKMYKWITCDQVVLKDAAEAPRQIDKILAACLKEKKPVYIGLPTDIANTPCSAPTGKIEWRKALESDPKALKEAIEDAATILNKSKKPIILGGMELMRYKLQTCLLKLLEQSGYPYATMLLDKTVIDEDHPQFIGLYEGDRSRKYVQTRVESADCIFMIGTLLTDFNTGGFTAKFDSDVTITAHIDTVTVRNHMYQKVFLGDFLDGLAEKLQKKDFKELDIHPAVQGCVHRASLQYRAEKENKLTIKALFDQISKFIKPDSIVLAETGNALFSAAETLMPKGTTFIGQGFYGSIGYTVGACLGTCIAAPDRQTILLVGDGSFQMTMQELANMIRYNLTPQVFLINNDGYTIERWIIDNIYNDIPKMKYHMLPEVFGGKRGFDVYTEGDLEKALEQANQNKQFSFFEVHTEKWDASPALQSAGKGMAQTNKIVSK